MMIAVPTRDLRAKSGIRSVTITEDGSIMIVFVDDRIVTDFDLNGNGETMAAPKLLVGGRLTIHTRRK